MPAKFCSECGTLTETRTIDGRFRSACPACSYIHYDVPKLGAGALIERDGRLLLVLRSDEPFANHWNLPAGFVEVDESPGEAAQREAQEETGLRVVAKDLDNVYSYDDDPRGRGVLIVYRCVVIDGQIEGSDEGRDVRYFPKDALPDAIAGGGHDQAISAWLQRARL